MWGLRVRSEEILEMLECNSVDIYCVQGTRFMENQAG